MNGYGIKDRIYELLPSIYRQQDYKKGKPLEALLKVIAEQVEVLENDIESLYDNWFIETCEEWVISYIADLLGVKGFYMARENNSSTSGRAFVANTISYRRHKGTVAILEQLSCDVTDWPAKALEFFQFISTTQNLNHLRPSNLYTPDFRKIETLDLINTPFDTVAHTVDIRNINSAFRSHGYYNIPNIGIFLWRLHPYPAINVPAYSHGDGKFSFSQIGIDLPLFNHPLLRSDLEPWISKEINFPAPIRRLALYSDVEKAKNLKRKKSGYYAVDGSRSIMIRVGDEPPTNVDKIVVCNLSDWKHRPRDGEVAIDPELGRIFLPLDEKTQSGEKPKDVHVSYYYGFSGDVGGGFYTRHRPQGYDLYDSIKYKPTRYKISKNSTQQAGIFPSISKAIEKWKEDGQKSEVIFEILDSEIYDESIDLAIENKNNNIDSHSSLEISSAEHQRPVLRGYMQIKSANGANIILEGLVIDRVKDEQENNRPLVRIDREADLDTLTIRHCTLVPRRNISLEVDGNNDRLLVTVDRTICGRIKMSKGESKLKVIESIVDGKVIEKITYGKVKYNWYHDDNTLECYEITEIHKSTIIGRVKATLLRLASNSIFTDLITSERHQVGCVRFCYLPLASNVPKRFHCQPEVSYDKSKNQGYPYAMNVLPSFTTENYGDPGFAQLHKYVSQKIFEGADNRSEMGVFNYLCQTQRIKILKSVIDDYLRFGMEAGVFLVT
jgi:hypothetical protein